jgi:hypothetical protein
MPFYAGERTKASKDYLLPLHWEQFNRSHRHGFNPISAYTCAQIYDYPISNCSAFLRFNANDLV